MEPALASVELACQYLIMVPTFHQRFLRVGLANDGTGFYPSFAAFDQKRQCAEADFMKRRPTQKDWLPLSRPQKAAAEPPTGEAFRVEWIDFDRGIRVGNLEPHERITQILKHGLEQRHGTAFVTDRWGRGVFRQWICWVPRADRDAKQISHDVNFGCAKLFIFVDREAAVFQSGLQVERGSIGREAPELRVLCRRAGTGTGSCGSATRALRSTARWNGRAFSCSVRMSPNEVRSSSGYELVLAVLGVFAEVTEAMNQCMQIRLAAASPLPRIGTR
jgi:hypothetical protein